MISETKGRLFFIQTEPYIVFLDNNGKSITRKVLSLNKDNHTCYVRLNNKKILLEYF
jgi:hypothetical protein